MSLKKYFIENRWDYWGDTLESPRVQLIRAVLKSLPEEPVDFEAIQQALAEQCEQLFDLKVNFKEGPNEVILSKEYIEGVLNFPQDEPFTTRDTIDGLLGVCAHDLEKSVPEKTKHFYSARNETKVDKTEKLSILTQFFMANVNIYCKANGLSDENFGAVLDNSDDLSHDLVSVVCEALSSGDDVETQLCVFCNTHASEFNLSRALTVEDLTAIKQKFERTYRTVTATKENPHMDDFMILQESQSGKFVTHQGAICTDFSELAATSPSLDNAYFQESRTDFEAQHESTIAPKNPHIAASIELSIEELVSRIEDDSQFDRLPQNVKEACLKHPEFQVRTFLHNVAKGKQDEAEQLLKDNPEKAQELLLKVGTFTDYSGRTFNCTAYEYAYWAKDTHMRRMLENLMTDETKTAMNERIEALEADGLRYTQHGRVIEGSKHFDFTPLKTAYQEYLDGYNNWVNTQNWPARGAAWMKVGRAQRDVPAHVAQEYCHPNRSFDPKPQFNEAELPRSLKFYNWLTNRDEFWFPLGLTDPFVLGVDFALIRGMAGSRERARAAWEGRGRRATRGVPRGA